ncbi:uncharacterized protein LOC102809824 [Saccoglossus kowalevskii]
MASRNYYYSNYVADPDSDSDSDYDIDEREHHDYMLGMQEVIHQGVHHSKIKTGIKRRPGHYTIGTRLNAPKDGGLDHFYNGKHWEIDMEKPLERTTRGLTLSAVAEMVEKEQLRRVREDAKIRQMAWKVLSELNNEFKNTIIKSQEDHNVFIVEEVEKVEERKNDVMVQLGRLRKKLMNTAMAEDERARRVEMMNELSKTDQYEDDFILGVYAKAYADVNRKWAAVQSDFMDAMSDLDEVRDEEDHEIDDRYTEIKDCFVLNFKRASTMIRIQVAAQAEKRRQLLERRQLDLNTDKTRRWGMQRKDLTQQQLIRHFAALLHQEESTKLITMSMCININSMVMEEMARRASIRAADRAMAIERIRRIKEAEDEAMGRVDPVKEALKDYMVQIQEQMLLQKFHGHRVRKVKNQKREQYYPAESQQDSKLRNIRMKSRRQSCVIVDF